jgi:hypothetical protein
VTAQDAYRSAGQAVAAISEGLLIRCASVDGIEFDGDDRPSPLGRTVALTQIAIGLAGVAAVSRYSFGTLPEGDTSPTVSFSFNRQELDDLAEVRAIIDSIDPNDDEDIFFLAWRQAKDLIADGANWEAIEWFAPLIEAGPLDGLTMFDMVDDHSAPV